MRSLSAVLCVLAIGCSLDRVGLRKDDAGEPRDASRDAAVDAPPLDVPTSEAGTPADGGDGGDPPIDGGSDGGAPDASGSGACLPDPSPPGTAMCPARCNGGCASNVCVIDCTGGGGCTDIVCPEEYACVVYCHETDGCDTGMVTCPPAHACTLVCGPGHDACGDLDLHCGSGSCAIVCEDDSCSGATIHCGAGACNATCTGTPRPSTTACEGSCACTPC